MKLSDVERKPPDILSDVSETEVYCLSDLSVFVFDRTVALSNVNQNRTVIGHMSDPNSMSSDILSDGPVKDILRPVQSSAQLGNG